MRVNALTLLEGPEVDDSRDVRLDRVDPERLADRLAVYRRAAALLLVSRAPNLAV